MSVEVGKSNVPVLTVRRVNRGGVNVVASPLRPDALRVLFVFASGPSTSTSL